MTSWSDLENVALVQLDPDTADRMLAGAVAPADAPPGYAGVARVLESAWSQPTAEELAGEEEIVAMIAAVVRASSSNASSSRRSRSWPAPSRLRLAAALVAAGLACSAGLASAGALPGIFQTLASATLAMVGVSVPDRSDETETSRSAHRASTGTPSRVRKGGEISTLARRTKRAGAPKGTAVSATASEGKSHAGQRRSAPAEPSNNGKSEIVEPTRETTRAGVVQRLPIPPPAGKGRRDTHPRESASSIGHPATPPSSRGTRDDARTRRSSTATSRAEQSGGGGSAPGSGNASRGQQGGAERSGGQGNGGSGNPGNGGQSGGPANGGPSPPGPANGNAGRNGRP